MGYNDRRAAAAQAESEQQQRTIQTLQRELAELRGPGGSASTTALPRTGPPRTDPERTAPDARDPTTSDPCRTAVDDLSAADSSLAPVVQYMCEGAGMVLHGVPAARPVINTGSDGCPATGYQDSQGGCTECEGDCDSDSDCVGNLECFERTATSQTVPGCESTGYQASPDGLQDWDYCYNATGPRSCSCSSLPSSICDIPAVSLCFPLVLS